MKKQLILENGEVFIGEGFGADKEISGEVVFNTGMTGYQEILSDPSYCAQIVTLTYPLIGNYGISREDFESINPAVHGLIVKELEKVPSHWRSEKSLDQLFKEKNIPGLEGIDTRRLTRTIREHGTLKGRICNMDVNPDEISAALSNESLPTDQVSRVSTKVSYPSPGIGPRVVIMDFGMKKGILRECLKRGFDTIVVPYNTPAEEILALNPDGVLLSNGPGDPTDVPEAVAVVGILMENVPVFGICLGHQLLALAAGAETVKMLFGHRGSNHPVKDLKKGRFFMTSQNHGYTVETESLKQTEFELTHVSVNDGTVEGMQHKTKPVFSVQFHPEATPGPLDSGFFFDQFVDMMQKVKGAERANV